MSQSPFTRRHALILRARRRRRLTVSTSVIIRALSLLQRGRKLWRAADVVIDPTGARSLRRTGMHLPWVAQLAVIGLVAILGFGLVGVAPVFAATFGAGDIAFVEYNADDPDRFKFVALVDIEAGTEIHFTDNGWLGDNSGFRSGEGIITWTAPPGGISAGVVVNIDSTPAASAGAVVKTGSFALSVDGDQLIAYQNSTDFLAAFNNEASSWQADATSSNTSALPLGLANLTTAVAIVETDNAIYTGSTSGDRTTLLAALNDPLNWTGSNSERQTFSASFGVHTAEISLSGNGVEIANGDDTPSTTDDTDYGNVFLGNNLDHTFIISNTGGADLTVGTVGLSGSASFSIETQPGSPVASGASTPLVIRFAPTVAGVVSATVSIPNSDADEDPFTFVVQGHGAENISAKVKTISTAGSSFSAGGGVYSVGVYSLTLTNKNISGGDLTNLFYRVLTITGTNELINADGGPLGVGAILTVPNTSLPNNPVWANTTNFTQLFKIGVNVTPIGLKLELYTLGLSAADGEAEAQLLGVVEFNLDLDDLLAPSHQIFIPLLSN